MRSWLIDDSHHDLPDFEKLDQVVQHEPEATSPALLHP